MAFQATAKRAYVKRTLRDFQSEKRGQYLHCRSPWSREPEERMQGKHSGCRSMQHPRRTRARTHSLFGHPKAQDPSIHRFRRRQREKYWRKKEERRGSFCANSSSLESLSLAPLPRLSGPQMDGRGLSGAFQRR